MGLKGYFFIVYGIFFLLQGTIFLKLEKLLKNDFSGFMSGVARLLV